VPCRAARHRTATAPSTRAATAAGTTSSSCGTAGPAGPGAHHLRRRACGRAAVTRGWCHGHYLRWSRTGDVRADVPLRTTAERRLRHPRLHPRGPQRPVLPSHYESASATGIPCRRAPADRHGEGSISHGLLVGPVPPGLRHLVPMPSSDYEHRW
jgi:hypothetical protein